MSKNKDIILPARYGYQHKLKYLSGNLWVLEPDSKSSGMYRIIGSPDDIHAIDPDGGPFISIDTNIEGKTVKSITINGIIELV